MLTLSAKRSLHPVSRTIGFSRRPTESILLQTVNRRLNMPGGGGFCGDFGFSGSDGLSCKAAFLESRMENKGLPVFEN